jgi:hypothetical protein
MSVYSYCIYDFIDQSESIEWTLVQTANADVVVGAILMKTEVICEEVP